jgi:chromosome segregation ATPase
MNKVQQLIDAIQEERDDQTRALGATKAETLYWKNSAINRDTANQKLRNELEALDNKNAELLFRNNNQASSLRAYQDEAMRYRAEIHEDNEIIGILYEQIEELSHQHSVLRAQNRTTKQAITSVLSSLQHWETDKFWEELATRVLNTGNKNHAGYERTVRANFNVLKAALA